MGGGGVLGQNSSKGGFRVQVRGNFHILTSKKKKTSEGGGGGLNPLTPPPPLDPLLLPINFTWKLVPTTINNYSSHQHKVVRVFWMS